MVELEGGSYRSDAQIGLRAWGPEPNCSRRIAVNAIKRSTCSGARMVTTWKSGAAPDEACPKCKSVYEVKLERFPLRDSDNFSCVVCGTLLKEWNSTHVPQFHLKTRGEPPTS